MQSPIAFREVLVVSDSEVFRSLIRLIFLPRARRVHAVGSRMQAREHLGREDLDLLVCDIERGTEGLGVLEDAADLAQSKPAILLVTSQPDPDEERRALERGATAYLSKPVTLHQLLAALKGAGSPVPARAPRRRPGGRACLVSPHCGPGADRVPQILWYVRDVSTSGAFLETDSPIPVGSRLDLALEIGGSTVHVSAVVERVQEPAWGVTPGIGVSFSGCGAAELETISAYVCGPSPRASSSRASS